MAETRTGTTDFVELEADLREMPLPDLRSEWQRHHPDQHMPNRLSRDLLIRSILYRLQVDRYGNHRASVRNTLQRLAAQLATSGRLAMERELKPKPGTRLIREWKGASHVAEIIDDGVRYEGEDYGSLSEVARVITGTRWSGPRFFGLKQPESSARDR